MLYDKGPIAATFDDSPEDGSKGVVFGFVGGDQARELRQALEAPSGAQAVIANYVEFFGAQAANPQQYIETAWKRETWTRGCPVGIPGLGQFCRPRRRRCASRSGASTGPAPRPRTTGPATWTAPCAPASAPRPRCIERL